MRPPRFPVVTAGASLLLMLLAACAPPPPPSSRDVPSGPAATATSAAALGGRGRLAELARKEGGLNVIALPPDWANYGKMISTFEKKYGITVHSSQPDANSEDEINAAKRLRGEDRAPDVFDLGSSEALANTGLFAPYRVTAWDSVPKDRKDPGGKWLSDYTGYMSIGYDSSRVPAPKKVSDLLKPAYRGKVALNGDPTQASAGQNGVVMAALEEGGSADDITPGVSFFHKLKQAGNLVPVDPTPATVASGQTPVVVDWDYNNIAMKGVSGWKVVVPTDAVVGAYYQQAVNKDAPHPAAARLWEEFVFSTQGQNIWLEGGARPVMVDRMRRDGSADKAALAKLPPASRKPVVLDEKQLAGAQAYLTSNWQKAVGG